MPVLALLMLIVGVFSAAAQGDEAPPLRGIAYVPEGHFDQRLDIALPEDVPAPYPTVLLFHGSGGSSAQFTPQRNWLAQQGYAVVLINYRDGGEVTDILGDAFCALGWVHAHADTYDLDTSRMATFGYSLGAWPASLLGTVEDGARFLTPDCPHTLPEDSRVQGVVTYAGLLLTPKDLLPGAPEFTDDEAAYLDFVSYLPTPWRTAVTDDTPDNHDLLPYVWLDAEDAPFLLIHSEDDFVVPFTVATLFTGILETAEISVELVQRPTGGHRMLYSSNLEPEITTAVDTFLAEIFAADDAATARPWTGFNLFLTLSSFIAVMLIFVMF